MASYGSHSMNDPFTRTVAMIAGALMFPVGILVVYGTGTRDLVGALVSVPVCAAVGYLCYVFWDRI